jgi:hypothetical protein
MEKKAQVIMLPSNKQVGTHNGIWLGEIHKDLFFFDGVIQAQGPKIPQHLYFITDEEIKGNDWILIGENNYLRQVTRVQEDQYLVVDKNNAIYKSACKKIVATTDPALYFIYAGEGSGGYVPKIDSSFIEEYVKQQGKITEVLLEYTKGKYYSYPSGEDSESGGFNSDTLKFNYDGFVIWKLIEEKKYTKEQIFQIIRNYNATRGLLGMYSEEDDRRWLDKNYPK